MSSFEKSTLIFCFVVFSMEKDFLLLSLLFYCFVCWILWFSDSVMWCDENVKSEILKQSKFHCIILRFVLIIIIIILMNIMAEIWTMFKLCFFNMVFCHDLCEISNEKKEKKNPFPPKKTWTKSLSLFFFLSASVILFNFWFWTLYLFH